MTYRKRWPRQRSRRLRGPRTQASPPAPRRRGLAWQRHPRLDVLREAAGRYGHRRGHLRRRPDAIAPYITQVDNDSGRPPTRGHLHGNPTFFLEYGR